MRTIAELLHVALAIDPRDRELLLAHVLGQSREWIIAHPETPVHYARVARYRRLLARLHNGEPLPHLLGEWWFSGRPFTVNRHVLIPRPETELLVELAVQHLRAQPTTTHSTALEPLIMDIGTGSGCMAVTLAAELPHARTIATDTSHAALRVARANARRHGVAQRITFLRGNLLTPLLASRERSTHGVIVILANLPYLTTAEWRALPRSMRRFEPRLALDGGPDGLRHFRTLCAQLAKLPAHNLRRMALLEIDPRRTRALAALVRTCLPRWEACWHRDLAGRWRVLELVARDPLQY